MSFLDNQFVVIGIGAVAGYLLYRLFTIEKIGSGRSKYEKELALVLNSGKYKVKGKFER